MVSPYDGVQTSPTIREHLQNFPGWLWASRNQKAWAIPLAPYIERYGLDITLMELKDRMRVDSLSLATAGHNGEYRFPPIGQVPETLRGYAAVDPKHLPAPLRGRGPEPGPRRPINC
jgi:hypothetical protein